MTSISRSLSLSCLRTVHSAKTLAKRDFFSELVSLVGRISKAATAGGLRIKWGGVCIKIENGIQRRLGLVGD